MATDTTIVTVGGEATKVVGTGTAGPQGPTGATGATGAAGADGQDGADGADGAPGADGKTVRNGTGAPSSGLGVDGDFYIDATADAIYGPKTAGAWGSPTLLIGPTGPAGADGEDGAQGPQGDPGEGVPTGGTAGQVLTKDSGTDYDTSWQDSTGGALTYPTLTWEQYATAVAGIEITGESEHFLPFDSTDGAALVNGGSWTINPDTYGDDSDITAIEPPPGIYAVSWTVIARDAPTTFLITMYVHGAPIGAQYAVAGPPAEVGEIWQISTIVNLTDPTRRLMFMVYNNELDTRGMYNQVTITRLDA